MIWDLTLTLKTNLRHLTSRWSGPRGSGCWLMGPARQYGWF